MTKKSNVDTTITTLEMCAGYGGLGLGLKNIFGERLRTIAYCELEGYAQANIISKMEKGLLDVAPIWSNLKTFPYKDFHGLVDILIAGYPCQPFSAAGKRAGKEDPRHLWPWIADGIRLLRPRMCYFENVEGHISLGLREVIGELEELGYKVSWCVASASECLDATGRAGPHQRKRVFILAYDKQQGLEGFSKYRSTVSRSDSRVFIRDGGCREELADASGKGHNRRELQNRVEGWTSGELPQPHAGKSSSVWSQTFRCGQVWPSGLGELAYDTSKGLPIGNRQRDEPEGQCNAEFKCGSHIAWPSRPGEQQFAWEPPRVVGGKLDHPAVGRCDGINSSISRYAGAGTEAENLGSEVTHSSCCDGKAAGALANNHSPHAGLGLQPEVLGTGYEAMGNTNKLRPQGRHDTRSLQKVGVSRAELARDGGDSGISEASEAMGNADHGRLASGINAGSSAEADRGGQGDIEQADSGTMGNASESRFQISGGQRSSLGESSAQQESQRSDETMGNSKCICIPTAREHGAMDEASGIPADREGSESAQTDPESGATRERENHWANASECSEIKCEMGRDAYEPSTGLDISELSGLSHQELAEICEWMVKCESRTDELRLLGNGVVPATAEIAYRVLSQELFNTAETIDK